MSEKVHTYEGTALTVTWDEGVCFHAAECVRGLPHVFKPGRRPWVLPDEAAADEVLATIARCPSGALAGVRKGAGAPAPAPEVQEINTVALRVNGPLFLEGQLELLNAEGEVTRREARVALCRCGASQNKPFCDGSHKSCGFADEGRPMGLQIKDDPEALAGPALRISARPNGPLIVDGPVRIVDAAGTAVCQGTRAALCRCGASSTRPLCDGTHKQIGFVAS